MSKAAFNINKFIAEFVNLKTANLKELLDSNKYVVINGTDDAVKSVIQKHLFINSLFAKTNSGFY
ncbi:MULTISPECIES: hypothetical protein [unclassified Polaribacter]|uniref:hypothetical protein n=1 Tax=unclassified Polaribacter TaxID=196858 RepID=UPI0011BD90CB|nr:MULTISPECIES: hypothetical protein [unclassified Polaribacter]TXD50799.1 hypothetical protein ES043_14635 [Polaribacter sp. IC063]TXD57545.1 hypothetical protein ES044_14840 [Polaribacter sp. IC066]